MAKKKKIRGYVYGRWQITDSSYNPGQTSSKAKVQVTCNCGTIKEVPLQALLFGNSNSCGCLRRELAAFQRKAERRNEVGESYGRYTVIADSDGPELARYVLARCTCGTEKRVQLNGLRNGHVISCGCANRERMCKEKPALKHGLSHRPEYFAWYDMLDRCYNAANTHYKDYGGRGLRVYAPWKKDVATFISHVGERPSSRHSLDRIDNNKGYYPDNVRWATRREQSLNKRDNCLLTFGGKTKSATLWAEETGIPRYMIYYRKRRGLSDHEVLTTPYRPRK